MKTKILWLLLPVLGLAAFYSVTVSNDTYEETARVLTPSEGCVFMTIMGEQSSEDFKFYKSDQNLTLSVRDGLSWLADAQLPNGGCRTQALRRLLKTRRKKKTSQRFVSWSIN